MKSLLLFSLLPHAFLAQGHEPLHQTAPYHNAELTCNNGYNLAFSCAQDASDVKDCTCTCSNGLTFTYPHLSLWGNGLTANASRLPSPPCLGELIQDWTQMKLPHEANTREPSSTEHTYVNNKEDSILLVADSPARLGETSGDGKLDNFDCGMAKNCMENYGGSFGIAQSWDAVGQSYRKVQTLLKWIGQLSSLQTLQLYYFAALHS
ncbi:hypothetical protein DM02DRAFT_621212 [Periconia macrospinosa]|uniref:Cyanovirin-N domain-containing protein n=1 Tax=Periconia macrospinosa TaxID=97972 RepID=A0A2V1EDB3_9PLEO|nr:hypothetical protein DM02DRAFT_621212 [Periconia macrospinosa]